MMSLAEYIQQSSKDEESFIILGTSPTPSMADFSIPPASVVERNVSNETIPPVVQMQASTQLDSIAYSLLANGVAMNASMAQQTLAAEPDTNESSPSLIASTKSTASMKQPGSEKMLGSFVSIGENENTPIVPNGAHPTDSVQKLSASFILGNMEESTESFDGVMLLQKLSMEHSQMKESLQQANVAMSKNFASIQRLQDETKARTAELDALIQEQRRKLDEQSAENGKLVEENSKLSAALSAVEAAAAEKEKQMENANKELQAELAEIGQVRELERKGAQSEMDELRQLASERQAVIQNLAKNIEHLELQIKGFVVVNSNKPDGRDGSANFVSAEVHRQELKALERKMSVEVAKNLEFEDMRKIYVDEINCLKTNLQAAENVFATSRVETQKLFEDVKGRDDTILKLREEIVALHERIQVLAAQSDIFETDFEAERKARQELASEKSRILTEFEVLQRRNTELSRQVSQSETEREEIAKRAAKMVQEATSSEETPEASGSSVQSEPKETLSLLRCPLCLKGYKDFGSLQSHAADCMGVE
ncbi:NF-kappa-B essential modulator [Anopheles nili]|uniref:NF-kappa-B essential modulator n=1 Tax=Anopheles nili TaxID=185578 RepID=UPI00237BCD04|nr:NF-kappa-B essential modulator [Anopheles nili]